MLLLAYYNIIANKGRCDVRNVNESLRMTNQPQETDALDAGAVTAEEAE